MSEGGGIISYVTFKEFNNIIGANWEEAMKKNEKSHEVIFYSELNFN